MTLRLWAADPAAREWRNERLAEGNTPAQSTPRVVTLWGTLPRGPVRDSLDCTVDTLCSYAVGGRPGGPASDGAEA